MNSKKDIQLQLHQLKQKLFDLSARNPLVNTKPNNLWFLDEDLNNASKIYKKQQFFKKEYGLQTVLLVSHFIKWKPVGKTNFFISPLLYKAIEIKKNQKISLQFNIDYIDEEPTINPILKDEFLKQFNIDLNNNIDNVNTFINTLKSNLENNQDKIETTKEWNENDNWQIIEIQAVGHFNYKKSVLGEDYNTIIDKPTSNVKNILGFGSTKSNKEKSVVALPLSDLSQQRAIQKALTNNIVIQGPPGTGKSHTIVELLKQYLLEGKKVLFVSEKKSALDVVYEKLKAEHLEPLIAYFNGEKHQKKEFYKHLAQTVNQTFNTNLDQKQLNFKTKELENYFKIYTTELTQLNQHGTSIYYLLQYLAKAQIGDLEYNLQHQIPKYDQWENYLEFLNDVEQIAQHKFDTSVLAKLPFIGFNRSAFLNQNPLAKIEKRLTELSNILKNINNILNQYQLNWNWNELNKHCLSASVLSLANKSQLAVLDPNSKAYKSFDTWTKKYELTQNKLKLSDELCQNWKQKPKLNEIDALIDDIEQASYKKWWQIFKSSKANSFFKSNSQENLSDKTKIKTLQDLKQNYVLQSTLNELKIKLKHNLNIVHPETEIGYIFQLRQKLDVLSHNEYVFLLEHTNSIKLIEDLHQLQPKIQQFNQISKFLFTNFELTTISTMVKQIERIKAQTPKFKFVIPEIKKFLNLPPILFNFIKHNEQNIKQLTDIVVYHNYLELVRFQPILKNLESIDILPNYKKLQQLKTQQNKQNCTIINNNWALRLKNIDTLVDTPSSKLKDEQKTEKKTLRESKRLIYHEIAKKQQHLPIKSLIKNTHEAIFNWQSLWMINPLSIGENLPCKADLFDVVVFDESSQIPLEDALPAIYRAKQTIVVGDSKQMPPSQFFSSSTETTTLLNQADSIFDSELLTWHYRSEHPRLMRFSNQHFYDNELNYFPANANKNPIVLKYVADGLFEDGHNIQEANQIAKLYADALHRGEKNIGIIAFSQAQEKQIEKQILKLNLPTNPELLIRNLENAQGIERENILISIGYGFNKKGNFNMNFGPINQDYGANRLNVLLTRAKQSMTVVTSVKSNDFKLSDNRGVQLLKDFLLYAEQNDKSKETEPDYFLLRYIKTTLKGKNVTFYKAINGLSVNCFIQHSTQKILLIDPALQPNENKDIYTILNVLDNRFKSIKVLLTHDYWHNKERFTTDVLTFFES